MSDRAVAAIAVGVTVGLAIAVAFRRRSTTDYNALALAGCQVEGKLARLAASAIRLTACVPGSDAYVEERVALARLLGQTNTYSTWSLSLKGPALLHRKFLHTAGRSVSPAELGVTATSTPAFLKALDLGGGDQRVIADLLAAPDGAAGAEALLVGNKKGDASRAYILTGGPLARRLEACALLGGRFPHMRFVAVHPEDEGRLTLQASELELARLLASSAGGLTHALLVAKGSTDMHMAWLDASGVATSTGCAMSEVHRPTTDAPSRAIELFSTFLDRPANTPLRAACAEGRCAVVFAGTSMHAVGGKAVGAAGDYFRRLAPSELAAADPLKSEFERFVGLGWNAQIISRITSEREIPAQLNAVFIGAMGPSKPRLANVA